MDIAVEDLAGGITKVVLRGRFDTTGRGRDRAAVQQGRHRKNVGNGRSGGSELPRHPTPFACCWSAPRSPTARAASWSCCAPTTTSPRSSGPPRVDALNSALIKARALLRRPWHRDARCRACRRNALVLGNDLAELTRLAEWLRGRGRGETVSSDVSFAVQLCLEEAVANVIMYGATNADRLEIAVELERSGGTSGSTNRGRRPAFRSDRRSGTAPRVRSLGRRQDRRPRRFI